MKERLVQHRRHVYGGYMLCAAQVWDEEEVMFSTGGWRGVKERLCVAQEASVG
jgi:hypothetical protein